MVFLKEIPEPGRHLLFFRGDSIEFTLEVTENVAGQAFLRTNIGNAAIHRAEIIENVEFQRPLPGQDWHDIPMTRVSSSVFSVRMALAEVGHFEGKCFFIRDDDGEPVWLDGDNVHINVEPAEYCCANSIYCAFVRQFGLNRDKKSIGAILLNDESENIKKLDAAGFAVIPPSGTFRDLVKELDHITEKLKCRIVHLLPINPTPTVFARMGRFGSPYASLDFTGIDPALAEFDKKATPLDQFLELVDAVHRRNAKLFIDIAINHTGWAARIHEEHPEWLLREADSSIHSPGAWGVTWGDLTELNHKCLELWKYLGDVFLTWCSRGVDGFRCDAGYMIPAPAWEYIISRVRNEYPDAIFLLEGLGGDPAVTRNLLDVANMNWAYSELFQNYSRHDIENYVSTATALSAGDGIMVHYAETHDNLRLAGKSELYAMMRTAISALLSSNGAFGFANGVEWFAKDRIDVHEAHSLNWGAAENQISFISRLNAVLMSHPAFHNNAKLKFIDSGSKDAIAVIRSDADKKNSVLILVNLDCNEENIAKWSCDELPEDGKSFTDLISELKINPRFSLDERRMSLTLKPGHVLCLSPDPTMLYGIHELESKKIIRPGHIDLQRAKALVLEILCSHNRSHVMPQVDLGRMASDLLADHKSLLESLFGADEEVPVVYWNWPEDISRQVMVPPGHMIVVNSPSRFSVSILDGDKVLAVRNSLPSPDGTNFAVFSPMRRVPEHRARCLKIAVYAPEKVCRNESSLLFLSADTPKLKTSFDYAWLRKRKMSFMQGNGRGALLHPCLDWSVLRSRYDAFLSANLSTEYPEDRHIMWRRCRMWLIYHGRTHEFSIDSTESFRVSPDGSGTWDFEMPVGNGLYSGISVNLSIDAGRNAVRMQIMRKIQNSSEAYIEDRLPVCIIIRPDIEDRNFHQETKAFTGPEKTWPGMMKNLERGFHFVPWKEREFSLGASKGLYHPCPEWQYAIYQENEAARGLDALGDLFSPGYFEISLDGGDWVELLGQITTPAENEKLPFSEFPKKEYMNMSADPSMESVLARAMKHYIVKRGSLKTVIAGYPWFLDWGRDTLICARGLISGGMTDDVRKILTQFARFAENGTIPNMINGDNAANRDTSDAPLWLFTAIEDLCNADSSMDFLLTKANGARSIQESLECIAHGYMNGTPNGIKMDQESGLIFSPSHFTWMDTNYPAGTPRQGYPIEIQALWHAALNFLYKATSNPEWSKLAAKVKDSIKQYFVSENLPYLSDCLHCEPGVPASAAVRDDQLRPNQLYAITLKAVDDLKIRKSVLSSCASLLIPGAIRSLADRKFEFNMPINGKNGELLNDPRHPYKGIYEGDEDTKRKAAYHNGTAWTWQFPAYSEAYYMVYKEAGRRTARSILSSASVLLNDSCVGQLPEILDGDIPHKPRGCDAQAWGVTELYRVWKLLH